ncbi:hypothetical protein AGABI2DRAFT_117450 [Agaricus bisporus var. bisporus H97]|uniref:hypothetical protein n=1 Tax=Agaricus bisporus var. bisporus (strain H97 / ATCC MYA-4626 / FGSC 10389) TaxID=936046 RepID=UPI00029F7B51|nr:hypothetical protein AGABI2DRAFT_117450 [Agaricus bisporus var. bisporus H97]EKV48647.1 hypothetical protein AGABI2DRAFT_117450 [Agaricus bisporus var. bisporus H97]
MRAIQVRFVTDVTICNTRRGYEPAECVPLFVKFVYIICKDSHINNSNNLRRLIGFESRSVPKSRSRMNRESKIVVNFSFLGFFITLTLAIMGFYYALCSILVPISMLPLIGRNSGLCGFPAFQPICNIPTFWRSETPRTNFSGVAETEIKDFEALLDEAAAGPTTAVSLKKAQKLSLRLLQTIRASHMSCASKDLLVELLHDAAEDAGQIFASLVYFHSRVDAAVRRFQSRLRSPLAEFPFRSIADFLYILSHVKSPQLGHLQLLNDILQEFKTLEYEVETILSNLQKLDDMVDGIQNLALIDFHSAKYMHDHESLRWAQRLLGWNAEEMFHLAEMRNFMNYVVQVQQRISAYVVNTRAALLGVNASLWELDSEANMYVNVARLPGGKVLFGLNLGLDKLRSDREKSGLIPYR